MLPKLETCTTPGTDLDCFSSVQSSRDFRSMLSYCGFVLRSVYQYMCPTGLQSVPICGCNPGGSVTCESRSSTFSRFQSFTESSSKIIVRLDRPASDVDRRCVICGMPAI